MKSIAKFRAVHITVISFLLFSFACSAAPNITATATAKPADTATSTYTPDPTATTQPTFTLQSTPAPTPMLISTTGRVIRSEHFDSLSTISFDMYVIEDDGKFDTLDGQLVLTDKISASGNPWADGHVAGRSFFSPQVGNVSVFLFKAEGNTYFGYHFELYENTADGLLYRGINLDCCIPGLSLHIDRFLDDSHVTPISLPVPQFRHGIWYFYALQVQPDGLVTAQIWERDQPNTVIFNRSFQLEEEWTKPGFTFVVAVDQGKMEVDEYQEVVVIDGATATP